MQERARAANVDLGVDAESAIHAQCDPQMLETILSNLLENAFRFAPNEPVQVAVTTNGRELCITVLDHGTGIPDTDFERIFEEFYQVGNAERNRDKGLGLGLPIARRLARLQRGDLYLERHAGHGARFVLRLPLEQLGASSARS
ncbi:MAG: ATP-binding protein [Burkholderiaceae bacterium]